MHEDQIHGEDDYDGFSVNPESEIEVIDKMYHNQVAKIDIVEMDWLKSAQGMFKQDMTVVRHDRKTQ